MSDSATIMKESRSQSIAAWRAALNRVTARLLAETGPGVVLAFSGGTDSRILAASLHSRGVRPRLLTIAVSPSARDAVGAMHGAAALGLEHELVIVTQPVLAAVLARHRSILASLRGTTQRVLAACELILCESARDHGERAIWTGHGPESILGGFRRRPAPDPDDTAAMRGSLELNARRLTAVSSASGIAFVLPFHHPESVAATMALRRSGATHADLAPADAAPKAALQNGSGIHYLLERMARANGYAKLGAWLDDVLAAGTDVSPEAIVA